jgi:hypothetical protein
MSTSSSWQDVPLSAGGRSSLVEATDEGSFQLLTQ